MTRQAEANAPEAEARHRANSRADDSVDSISRELEHRLERLAPRALLAPTAGAGHALAVFLGLLACVTFSAVAFGNLPGGLALMLVVVPAAFWTWLSVAAIRANRGLDRDLLDRGVVVRGQVHTLEVTPTGGVRLAWGFPWRATPGAALVAIEGRAEIGRWARRRYFQDMQVALLVDPERPDEHVLFPPPGGGSQFDLFSDAAATFMNPTSERADGASDDGRAVRAVSEPPRD